MVIRCKIATSQFFFNLTNVTCHVVKGNNYRPRVVFQLWYFNYSREEISNHGAVATRVIRKLNTSIENNIYFFLAFNNVKGNYQRNVDDMHSKKYN